MITARAIECPSSVTPVETHYLQVFTDRKHGPCSTGSVHMDPERASAVCSSHLITQEGVKIVVHCSVTLKPIHTATPDTTQTGLFLSCPAGGVN